MRIYLYILAFFLPFKAWAACPELKYIRDFLPIIREKLVQNSDEPLVINGVKFQVRHQGPHQPVHDLLAGIFEGYTIDRLKETTPGVCLYRLRDNRTPVQGKFMLILQD